MVCFDTRLPPHLPAGHASYWREWLTPSVEIALSSQGHASIDNFMASLRPGMRALLTPTRPSLGSEAFRAMALSYCLSQESPPVLAVICSQPPLGIIHRLLPSYRGRGLLRLSRWLTVTYVTTLPLALLSFYLRSQFYDFRSAIRWMRWRDAWRAVTDTPRRISAWYRELQQGTPDGWPMSTPGTDILLAVEDSGSGLNSVPARHILEHTRARGHRVIVVTSTPQVADEYRSIGIPITTTPPDSVLPAKLLTRRVAAVIRRLIDWAEKPEAPTEAAGIAIALMPYLHRHVLMALIQQRMAFRLLRQCRPGAILGINEAIPLCICLAAAAKRLNLPCILHLPALIFDHPESKLFPAASKHLVYGDQARELLIGAGCPPDQVVSVGTALFDQTLQGDRTGDNEKVRRLLPAWRDERLIVIGTEHRAKQIDDIRAVLGALAGREGLLIVIKVHPADSEEQFRRLAGEFAGTAEIAVVGHCDLDALLACADLLICQRSNIIITAALLQTPVLVCDFFGSDAIFDFAREGLGRKCLEPDEIWPDVQSLVFAPDARARQLRRQNENLRRFNGPNDGHSAERIVGFLEAAMQKPGALHPTTA